MSENKPEVPVWEQTFQDEIEVPVGSDEILFNPGHWDFLSKKVFGGSDDEAGEIPYQNVRKVLDKDRGVIVKYVVVPVSLLVEKSQRQPNGQYSEVLGSVLDAIANEIPQFDLNLNMSNLEKYLAAQPSEAIYKSMKNSYTKLMSKLEPYGNRLAAAESYIRQSQSEFPENTFEVANQLVQIDQEIEELKDANPELRKLLRSAEKGERVDIVDQELRAAFSRAQELQKELAFIQTNNRLSTRVFTIVKGINRLEAQTQGEHFENLTSRAKARLEELDQQYS